MCIAVKDHLRELVLQALEQDRGHALSELAGPAGRLLRAVVGTQAG